MKGREEGNRPRGGRHSRPSRWERLLTEQVNPRTVDLDALSPLGIVDRIAREDIEAWRAVRRERRGIARAVALVAEALASGGRLLYVGAGTSGRLGVLDAAECPPTFGTRPGRVQGVIAGGRRAVFRSVEGAEDRRGEGRRAIARRRVGERDIVVGTSASSVTPFVLGALTEARRRGARTILLTCNPAAGIPRGVADCVLAPAVGPEVIAGSTRMKAGTATKMILNTLSTGAMVLLGKTYGNLMVDLRPWSAKLRDRAVRIIRMVVGCERREAQRLLREAGGEVKVAIVMGRLGVAREEARRRLRAARGRVRQAIGAPPAYAVAGHPLGRHARSAGRPGRARGGQPARARGQ